MNISQKAWQSYRKYFGSKIAIALSFTVFVLASLAIGMIDMLFFIILIPFVILPLFICLQLATSAFRKGMILSQKNFFGFYKTAFTPPLSGSYQVFSSFLKAALIHLGLSLVINIALIQVFQSSDAAFSQFLTSLIVLISSGGYQEAQTAIAANPTIMFISGTSALISGGLSLLAFLHFIGRNSIVPHLAFSMSLLPGKIAYSVHRQGLRFFKREFNLDYYKALWLGGPLVLLGFAGGVFATYFLTSNSYLVLLAGFAGTFIVITPFLPYFLDVIEELFNKYKDRYLQVSIDEAKKVYEEIKAAREMNEEQQDEIDRLIEDLEKKTTSTDEQEDEDNDKNDPSNH
ncbi:MAG: hypothetical protein WC344_03315 [Bacilli bacterium]|jgi:hypothetical protein